MLAAPDISDILVNGTDQVYVERNGRLEATDVRFRDDNHLRTIIDRIVSNVGRRIDESSPMVDARLPDGSRVNAIIPPLALNGAMVSIRRFAVDSLGPQDYMRRGTLIQPLLDFLAAAVKARMNVLISGGTGTGTGKTTMLNMLSSFISPSERILTIEDSAELQLKQPHAGRLETRPINIEGRDEITQRDLVRNALRMRPDRIIGKVRAGEAFDMLQAMNTGHDGSLTTVHANTARDALSRVENMVGMTGLELPAATVRQQIASAIDLVIQLERMEDGVRRVVSIQEIQGMEASTVTMAEIFRFKRQGIDSEGRVLGEFEPTGIIPQCLERILQHGLNLDITTFHPEQWRATR